ncbi:hypothetical protein HUJ05_012454 [Dendroctonus ponderosae]|nr:hypothetical protein HUJ05_012454 [Dendroctonus ponderosae]
MDVFCDHADDLRQLLLDDENLGHPCMKCLGNNNANGHVGIDFSSSKLVLEDPSVYDPRADNSEDSPLLVHEYFRDPSDDVEFHCHKSLSSTEDPKAFNKLLLASGFCFIFMLAELIGGYFAGSLAVMTDAAHLFSDFIGFLISLLAILLSRKPATKHMTFGYYRSEVLGAFLSVLTIWFLVGIFLVLALKRLYLEEYNIDANTMIIVASIGLLVNIIMGAVLHGICHGHSHGPQLQDPDNINVRAASAHVLGDLVQSIGVLLAAVIIKIFPNAQAADPICTLIFSVIIIFTTARVGKDSIGLLMQGSPVTRDKLSKALKQISGVRHVHDVNIWSLTPGRNVVTAHLAVGYNSGFNDSNAGGFLNNTTNNDSPSGKEPKVSLVGILLEFDVQSTKASYTIQDHTGSIKAIFWLEGENGDEACKMPAVKEGGYVKVYGTIRNQEGEKALMVLKMFPIDDCNIILTHLMEVIDTRLQAEVMSKNTAEQIKQNNPGASLANSMTMFDENVVDNGQHNLSGIQLKVYKFLQSVQGQAGPDRASILAHFPSNQRKDANEALEFLVNEGHAYSTIDNDHFKPTDV